MAQIIGHFTLVKVCGSWGYKICVHFTLVYIEHQLSVFFFNGRLSVVLEDYRLKIIIWDYMELVLKNSNTWRTFSGVF